ncbi:MAG TPA: helix-turn-helix domain-containing protein [Puia sp.]|nr:helix-turn-helix domain-containing protein [Puia sp.]
MTANSVQLYDLRQKQGIPLYTLSQISEDGNNLFEIKEIDRATVRHSSHLFLPHRKDYYFFFLVKDGANHHWIDFVSHDVQPGHLFFTLPHQVHLKEKHAPVGGTLLTFTEDFLLTEGHGSWKELPILQNPEEKQSVHLSPADQEFLTGLMNQMLAEHKKGRRQPGSLRAAPVQSSIPGHDQPDRYVRGMLESYLHIFLLFLSRLYQQQFDTGNSSADRSLLRRFKELIDDRYDTLHQVSDYARLLNVSPGHLNDIVRAHTGRTATSFIHQRVVLEGKRLLFHADLSVKEIGYSLGFDDAAYFSRFFKRLTGETPATFRNSIREKYH